MIQGRCPICAQPYRIRSLDELPSFPFCSERCRSIDLGRWIDGAYVVPVPETPTGDDPSLEADEDRSADAGD
jgi:endogenous inhibitor of DNA gyrase (YacG/DUF329 family)